MPPELVMRPRGPRSPARAFEFPAASRRGPAARRRGATGPPRVAAGLNRAAAAGLALLALLGLAAARPAGAEIAPGRVVVGFWDASAAGRFSAARAAALGLRAGLALGPLTAQVVEVPAGTEADWAARLAREPGVRYAEPDALFHAALAPSDSLYSQQWHLHNSGDIAGTAGNDIGAESAWNRITDSGWLILAVLDTGVDFAHPDLGTNIFLRPPGAPRALDPAVGPADDTRGWNFVAGTGDPSDDNGHGTAVIGTLGALGNNRRGVSGVLWRTQILAVKVLNNAGVGRGADLATGVLYAVNAGARILNLSLSGTDRSTALYDAIAYARDHGVLVVVSAGNDGVNLDTSPRYPAAFDLDNLVAVAATDRFDALLSASNRGSRVLLAAPGHDILTTRWGGGYTKELGTSFSAPLVAGAAALYWTLRPWETYAQVVAALGAGVKPLPGLAGLVASGGRLDLGRLVSEALADSVGPAAVTDLSARPPQGTRVTLTFTAPGEDGRVGRAEHYEARWSLAPLTGANFDTARVVPAPQPPVFGGWRDSLVADGMPLGRTVHFAVRAVDRVHTRGPVSNDAFVVMPAPPALRLSADSLAISVQSGRSAVRTLTLYNVGGGRLDGELQPFPVSDLTWSVQPGDATDFQVAPHDSVRLRLNVGTDVLTAGPPARYAADIASNDPVTPLRPFVVVLTVTPAAPGAGPDTSRTPSARPPAGRPGPRAPAERAPDFSARALAAAPGGPVRFALGAGWAAAPGLRARVLDVTGRAVAALAPAPGRAELSWDGRVPSGAAAASGIYFLVLEDGGRRSVVRFLRLR